MRIRCFLFLAGLLLATAAACTSGQTDTPVPGGALGTLAGSVTIGPLCPVEPCSRQIGDTYSSRQLQLRSEAADDLVVVLNQDGTFRTPVPIGEYDVHLSNCDYLGCFSSLPVTIEIEKGQTFDLSINIDTGIRSAVQSPSSQAQLSDDLRNAGAVVELGGDIEQPFFSVPGRVLTVNGIDIQVFEYPSADDAQAEAAKVAPDGGSIGTSMVMWVATPHFYSKGTLIVLYVGDDNGVQTLLESALGSQFAGGGSSTSGTPDTLDVSSEADSTARRELSGRLGVAPEDFQLVHFRESAFSDGALGCPDPGVSYTQAIVPGYVLLYELNGVRYPFHISTDGRLFTDCRGENNVAVPFRLADDIVTVEDAFQLAGGTPSHLGKEVVLQTLADARAYTSQSGGLVKIDLDRIDWGAEMLVGTVISGSGCGFEVVTPLVIMRHLGKTVDVDVEATQTGLCEKAWAQPVWLVVQEVPKDYSADFILSYATE